MINGAHAIIFSKNPEADRAFLKDVLGLPHVDAGQGWLIFGLPPSEVAIHDAEDGAPLTHQLYLMCHDVEALLHTFDLHSIESAPVQDEGWGLVTEITLPGGAKLPIYQPQHPRPAASTAPRRSGAPKKKGGKKASKRAAVARSAKPAKKKKAAAAAKRPGKAAPKKKKAARKRGR